MKKPIALFLCMLMLGASTITAAASGNPKKGKHLYKNSCKSCHNEGSSKLTPMDKTQAQWSRFFEKNQHEPEVLKGLSEKDLQDIRQYLINHAADSDQPETCG
jgi:cytochrome c553